MSGEEFLQRRIRRLLLAICLAGAVVLARLVEIQLLRTNTFQKRARSQHEATVRLEGQRGTITDRNGRELAASIEVDSVFVHPWQLKDASRTARLLATALGMEPGALQARILQHHPFVWIKRKISPAERERIERIGLKGEVHFARESKRFYPRGSLGAHALGFVGTDGVGLEGLEKDFDGTIRGEGASFVVLRDAKGGAILQQVQEPARPGASIELTLDETIQHAAEEELDAAMARTRSAKGAIIVADPRSGDVLAIASRPGFDPNRFSIASAAQRRNIAIGERYEPGSTFKIITAATGLEEGRVRPSEWFDCGNGSIVVNTVRIRDHHSYSSLTFSDVIAKSSNVGIIRLGLRLGAPLLHSYVGRFGFGQSTEVGLSGEAEGIVNSLPRWSALSVASVSMGQEILVTPIQMLQAFSAIANGGILTPPHLVKAVVLPDGRRIETPLRPSRRVVSTGTTRTLTALMEQVVLSGTGQAAAIEGYRVAGKTGTAQKIGPDGRYSHWQHVSSFIGFAPTGAPKVAAIVVLDDPKGAYYGGDVAAPSFSRVMARALERLRVMPDEEEIPPAPPSGSGKPDKTQFASRPRVAPGQAKEAPLQWPPSPSLLSRASAADGVSGAVPDVFGLSLRGAVSRLAERGYRAVSSGNGFVVTQDPLAGSQAEEGTVCRLLLSADPPDVTLLAAADLQRMPVESGRAPAVPAGTGSDGRNRREARAVMEARILMVAAPRRRHEPG